MGCEKRPSIILLIFVFILVIIITVLVTLVATENITFNSKNLDELESDSDESVNENINNIDSDEYSEVEKQTNSNEEVDLNKELVIDASYFVLGLPESYSTWYNKTYYLKDIVAPYINIGSEDGKKVNNEIEDIYNECAYIYRSGAESEVEKPYVTLSYTYYQTNDTLSVVIKRITGCTDVPQNKYYTYTFDLKTLELCSYSDVYTKCGFNSSNILDKVESAINNHFISLDPDVYWEYETSDKYIDYTINAYKNSFNSGTIKYYIDNSNNMNIITDVYLPVGIGHFETIITIK